MRIKLMTLGDAKRYASLTPANRDNATLRRVIWRAWQGMPVYGAFLTPEIPVGVVALHSWATTMQVVYVHVEPRMRRQSTGTLLVRALPEIAARGHFSRIVGLLGTRAGVGLFLKSGEVWGFTPEGYAVLDTPVSGVGEEPVPDYAAKNCGHGVRRIYPGEVLPLPENGE